MGTTSVTRSIEAPVERVFETISDIRNYSKAIPDIVNVEFLTDSKAGVGTRFRETRLMSGREVATVLEVTELVDNDRIRIVSDTGGTVWDSVFTVKGNGGSTELNLTMDANAYKLRAKIMNLLIRGMLAKALARDMDAVKAYCEQ